MADEGSCAHCGTEIDPLHALEQDGLVFCSEECAVDYEGDEDQDDGDNEDNEDDEDDENDENDEDDEELDEE